MKVLCGVDAAILFIDLFNSWLHVHFLQTIASNFFQVIFVCKYQMSKEPLLFSPFPLVFGRQQLGVGRKKELKATLTFSMVYI